MEWKIAALLVYGVVKEFRPATPFLTPFLISEYKNFTVDQVYSDIYPFWTYTYLVSLVPVFVLTDVLRYKPVIILEALAMTATWLLLTFAQGLWLMQLMQVCFGIASAAEVAFWTYLYAVVNQKEYKKVTSYIKTSVLIGKLFAFGLAQILISFKLGTYLLLNQISLGAVSLCLVIAVILPSVPKEKNTVKDCEESVVLSDGGKPDEVKDNSLRHKLAFYRVYFENRIVLKWSLCTALLSCAMYQVYNYVQPLWIEIEPDQKTSENGLVEFLNTILGAVASFGVQFLTLDWATSAEWILAFTALSIGGFVALTSYTSSLHLAYAYYITAVFIFHGYGTISSATIASRLKSQTYGMVLGLNTLVALILQSIVTFVAVDKNFFGLSIQQQFALYAVIFLCTGCGFIVWRFCSTPEGKQFIPDVTQKGNNVEQVSEA